MPPPSPNPYAPPDPSHVARSFSAPLPEGVRRFKLDVARSRAIARSLVFRRATPVATFALLVIVAVSCGFYGAGANVFPGLALTAVIVVVQLARQGRISEAQAASYELLLGPRVMRRTVGQTVPAEVLRPDVTSIHETRYGLWVCCAGHVRALFVVASVEGYAEVRAALGDWHPIELLAGWGAWRLAQREAKRQREWVAVGTNPVDASLNAELVSVRSASSDAWRAFSIPAARAKRRKRVLVLWALLVVVFLAIWQFLEPAPRPGRAPLRAVPSASREP